MPSKGPSTQAIAKKDRAEMAKLFKRAEQGDKEALALMREAFEERPSIWNGYADLASTAENSLIKMAATNPLIEESLRYQLKTLRKELSGPEPTPLEELLVRRIAVCWLQLHYLEILWAQNLEPSGFGRWADYCQRWIDRAQRRYLAAIKALTQVRRLLYPMVQVNLAEKQVNIARSH